MRATHFLHGERFRQDRGFTVLETVVAIIVGATLTSLAVVGAVSVLNQNKDSSARQAVQEIVSAETRSSVDSGQYTHIERLVSEYGLSAASRANAVVVTDSTGSCFVASKTSDTGTVFFATDEQVEPRDLEAAIAAGSETDSTGCGDFTYADIRPVDTSEGAALAFGSNTLPKGWVGNSYQGVITAAGTGVTFDLEVGTGQSFPDGLMLQASSGIIAGTPTSAGTFTFGVNIGDGVDGLGPKNYTIVIEEFLESPRFYDDRLESSPTNYRPFNLDVGIPDAREVRYAVAPSTPLPAGLSIDANTGVISGTVKAADTGDWDSIAKAVTVVASNPAGSDEIAVNLNILDKTLQASVKVVAGETIDLPLTGERTDVTILWGDGSAQEVSGQGTVSHKYTSAGTYTLRVSGTAPVVAAGTDAKGWDRHLTKITRWGEMETAAAPELGAATILTEVAEIPKDMTSLSRMFFGNATFNGDLKKLDTSRVTDMSLMFHSAAAFNGDISGWNTGKVTSMNGMFASAFSFNQPIGTWNTGSVTNFGGMFQEAAVFNRYLSTWDTRNAESMTYMFSGATAFNGDIRGWQTGKVTTTRWMFERAEAFNRDIDYNAATGAWDMSQVTNMSHMFKFAKAFNGQINRWNVSQVTDMNSMFAGTESFNRYINYAPATDAWNTGKVTIMTHMFYGSLIFNGDISQWRTDSLTDPNTMFSHTPLFNQPINTDPSTGAWNMSKVTTISHMFWMADSFNQNIGGWNTSNVTDMNATFSAAPRFNQPIGAWDVSKVTIMRHMFNGATAFNQPIASWRTANVTTMGGMFSLARNYNQYMNTAASGAWDVRNVTNFSNMFYGASKFNGNITQWVPTSATTMEGMFSEAIAFNQPIVYNATTRAWDTTSVTSMAFMFDNAHVFNANIATWKTQNVTAMGSMFGEARAFNRNISAWNVTKVTSYGNFRWNSPLTTANTPAKFR